MLINKPTATIRKTQFQKELDEVLRKRNSKGLGTGFSSDENDSYGSDFDDQFLKEFDKDLVEKDSEDSNENDFLFGKTMKEPNFLKNDFIDQSDDFDKRHKEPPKVKPRSRRNMKMSQDFDLDLSKSMKSKSPLLDFLKQSEDDSTSWMTSSKMKSETSADQLIESLLKGTTLSEDKPKSRSNSVSRHSNKSRAATPAKVDYDDEVVNKSRSNSVSRHSNKSRAATPAKLDYDDEVINKSRSNSVSRHSNKSRAATPAKVDYDDEVDYKSINKILNKRASVASNKSIYDKVEKDKNDSVMNLNDVQVEDAKETSLNLDKTFEGEKMTENILNEKIIDNFADLNKDLYLIQDDLQTQKTQIKKAKRKKPKPPSNYQGLGSLTAHHLLQKRSSSCQLEVTNSSTDIRQSIYLEWLAKREKMLKEKKIKDKKNQKEQKEKELEERQEKIESSELARSAWLERKKEELKEKERLKRKAERERRKAILEKEEEKWASSKKCNSIRKKALEDAKRKHREEQREKRREKN